MWRFVSLFSVSLAAASGCDSSLCDEDALEPELVVSSSTAGPGEIRSASAFGPWFPIFAARPEGGVVCLACTGLLRLDADLREADRIGSMKEPRKIAIGRDGTSYTTAPIPDEKAYEVIALDATGSKRWRARLPMQNSPVHGIPAMPAAIAADAERVYLASFTTLVLDGASGEISWSSPDVLLDVGRDGVLVSQGETARVETAQEKTVAYLDGSGAVIWRRSIKGPHITIQDTVSTPDGGAIVVGRGDGTVDLGDRVLEGPSSRSFDFIVEIDRAGAVRWAYKLDRGVVEHVALTERGEILLAGYLDSQRGAPASDSFLAVATPQEVVRLYRIGGTANQFIDDLQVSADGTALLQITSYFEPILGDPEHSHPTLEVGSQELDGAGHFLLDIVP